MALKAKDVKTGNYYKLLKPKFTTTFGQGDPPTGMKISTPDKEYFLKWNQVFKASTTVDAKNKIADITKTGYSKIHCDFVKQHLNQFQKITVSTN